MRLFHWYLHYIYDLILYLCIMYYTVCYLTGIFYAVVRQISMLFIHNKISVFCTSRFSTVTEMRSMFVSGGWGKADYCKLQDSDRKKISGLSISF